MLLRLWGRPWFEVIFLIHGLPYPTRLPKLLIEIRSLMHMLHKLRLRRACHSILVWGPCNILSGANDRIQLLRLFLLWSKVDHRKRCNSWSRAAQARLNHLGLRLLIELARIVRVKRFMLLRLLLLLLSCLLLLLCSLLTRRCCPLLRCTWPFLAGRILLCKPLFPSL